MSNLKTNAMRIIDKVGITYNTYTYDHSDGVIDCNVESVIIKKSKY